MAKQDIDNKTMELAVTAPYLVISQTKKGFREFKKSNSRYYWSSDSRWHWDKYLGYAERYPLEKLPELLKMVADRRTASVCLVYDGFYQVLGNVKYPV